MRIIWVWIVAIGLMFTVTLGWYIFLPVSFALSSSIEAQIELNAALNILRIVEFITIAWGPLWDLFIVFWAAMESQRIDPMSARFG